LFLPEFVRPEGEFACGDAEKGVVFCKANVGAGVKFRSVLANNYFARFDFLAAEPLNAEPLPARIASVSRTSYAFLVRHNEPPNKENNLIIYFPMDD
jgi:hypothetical protein